MAPDVRRWLKDNGFVHHCFISYPHTGGAEMREFADKVRERIEEELHNLVGREASVYFDERSLPVGHDWPEHLRENLCASVSMVAILTPVYVQTDHPWCAKEWAAMHELGRRRLYDSTLTGIIPVMFRRTELEGAAADIQKIDMSRIAVAGRRYYATREFRGHIVRIVDQIDQIAARIHVNRCSAELVAFHFSETSPFTLQTPIAPFGGHA
jgi:hypothetical protein